MQLFGQSGSYSNLLCSRLFFLTYTSLIGGYHLITACFFFFVPGCKCCQGDWEAFEWKRAVYAGKSSSLYCFLCLSYRTSSQVVAKKYHNVQNCSCYTCYRGYAIWTQLWRHAARINVLLCISWHSVLVISEIGMLKLPLTPGMCFSRSFSNLY